MPETQQETRLVYEYTRPVVKQVGREEGALKAVPGLPSCAPHPVTKHRIHHFVYFSQLSAYKKALGETRLSALLLVALKPLKQPDKTRPLHPPCSACQKGSSSLPLLSLPLPPSCPTPRPLLLHCSANNKALGSTSLIQRAGSSHWINQVKTAL